MTTSPQWEAYQEWLRINRLRNGNSQAAWTIWVSAWFAALDSQAASKEAILEFLEAHAGVNSTAGWEGSPNPSDSRNIRRVCKCGAVIGQLPYPKTGTFRLSGDPFDKPHREHIAEALSATPLLGEASKHPQFTAFLDEILQDDEVREAFEAAQQGRGAEDIESETVREWNVLDNGEPYLPEWTEDEWEARNYSNVVTGPLVYRDRTKFADIVSREREIK